MDDLKVSDFAPDQDYSVTSGGQTVVLRVDQVEELPRAVRTAGGFRLELVGPAEPMLPQATYALTRNGESRDIFLVPVARNTDGARYEAIFN
jgi:hypothetical protein